MAEDKSERENLEGLSDADLAHWQNGWNPEARRHILAQKEWARRLAMSQLQEQFKLEEKVANANRWWGVWAAVIGAFWHSCWRCSWCAVAGKTISFQNTRGANAPVSTHNPRIAAVSDNAQTFSK